MKKIFIFALIILSLVLTTQSLLADSLRDSLQGNLQNTGGTAYYGDNNQVPTETDPTILVANIIRSVLVLLGVWFVVLIIVSGFQWMNAGGNSDVVVKARQRIINATIGLVIVLFALTITTFIMNQIGDASGYNTETE